MIIAIALISGLCFAVLTGLNIGAFEWSFRLLLLPVLWLGYYLAALLVMLILLYIASLIIKTNKKIDKPNKFYFFIVKAVISFLVSVSRSKVIVSGGEKIEKGKQYLLVCNHRSRFDPMIAVDKFYRCSPMMISKPENFNIPIAGPFIKRAGFLAIDREDNKEALKTILQAIDFIKNYKFSIGIYPEGTRNLKSKELLPLKAGAFKIGVKANVPIVVATISGTENIAHNFPFKRTVVHYDIIKVITPSEYAGKSTTIIAEEVQKLMEDNLALREGKIESAKSTND